MQHKSSDIGDDKTPLVQTSFGPIKVFLVKTQTGRIIRDSISHLQKAQHASFKKADTTLKVDTESIQNNAVRNDQDQYQQAVLVRNQKDLDEFVKQASRTMELISLFSIKKEELSQAIAKIKHIKETISKIDSHRQGDYELMRQLNPSSPITAPKKAAEDLDALTLKFQPQMTKMVDFLKNENEYKEDMDKAFKDSSKNLIDLLTKKSSEFCNQSRYQEIGIQLEKLESKLYDVADESQLKSLVDSFQKYAGKRCLIPDLLSNPHQTVKQPPISLEKSVAMKYLKSGSTSNLLGKSISSIPKHSSKQV